MDKTVDQFELGEMIGAGTVGHVYRAKDKSDGTLVALKILLPEVSCDDNIAKRFRREMSVLEKLNHPHIVHYLSDGQHDGRLYYAMELVDFGSLSDELRIRTRLSWQETCQYGQQICSALQHAHNHGIVHRDLKPANLFMTQAGDLKLGDFGIARDLNVAGVTDEGMTVGTYAYMSPEQIRAEHLISDKTDLYAMGCLLYQMLTGSPPFQGKNFARIFDQHLHSEPPRVRRVAPDCPQELEDLIVRLMAKDPENRPFNARYVQGYLQDLLDKKKTPGNAAAGTSTDLLVGKLQTSGVVVPTQAAYRKISWITLAGITLLISAFVAVVWLVSLGWH